MGFGGEELGVGEVVVLLVEHREYVYRCDGRLDGGRTTSSRSASVLARCCQT